MAKQKGFWFKARRVVLCLLVLFMFEKAIEPKPAQALEYITDIAAAILQGLQWVWEKAKWVAQKLQLEVLVSFITDFWDLMNDLFMELEEAMRAGFAAINGAQQLEFMTRTQHAQALIDAKVMTDAAMVDVEDAMKNTLPRNEYLCKIVTGQKLINIADDWEKEVSRMAGEAVLYRYRCPTCDGSGVDYSSWEHAFRCGSPTRTGGASDVKFGNPLDGYDPACVNESITGSDGRKLMDADLTPPDGGQILALPAIHTREVAPGVTANVMVAGSPEESFWLAGLNYLFRAAGSRPTAVRAKNMETPTGRPQRAMFNHCAASEAALVKQCTDLLAFYTRPNCEQNPNYCLMQEGPCASAKGGLIESSHFGGCGDGLSPYEAMKLQYAMCKTPEHYVLQRKSEAKAKDLASDASLCTLVWSTFEELEQQKQKNCARAIEGFNEMGSCWRAVSVMAGTIPSHVAETEEAPVESGDRVRKVLAALMTVEAPEMDGIKKLIASLKLPVNESTIWPKAVAQ